MENIKQGDIVIYTDTREHFADKNNNNKTAPAIVNSVDDEAEGTLNLTVFPEASAPFQARSVSQGEGERFWIEKENAPSSAPEFEIDEPGKETGGKKDGKGKETEKK